MKRVLEMDGGDGYTTLWLNRTPQNWGWTLWSKTIISRFRRQEDYEFKARLSYTAIPRFNNQPNQTFFFAMLGNKQGLSYAKQTLYHWTPSQPFNFFARGRTIEELKLKALGFARQMLYHLNHTSSQKQKQTGKTPKFKVISSNFFLALHLIKTCSLWSITFK
jgi:hypothetical protein